MTSENFRIVVDSYAWIEYFLGTRGGAFVEKVILEAQEAYTPTIVLAEIAAKYGREGAPKQAIKERLRLISETTVITPITIDTATEIPKAKTDLQKNAQKLGLKQAPSLADAIILATARKLEARVLTRDQHFKNLKETLWIP